MAIGKPILEGSSQAQKRSRTQILTPSDPKISGKEPKTLSKRAHNPPPKQAGPTKPKAVEPRLGGRLVPPGSRRPGTRNARAAGDASVCICTLVRFAVRPPLSKPSRQRIGLYPGKTGNGSESSGRVTPSERWRT